MSLDVDTCDTTGHPYIIGDRCPGCRTYHQRLPLITLGEGLFALAAIIVALCCFTGLLNTIHIL